jgi:cytochrome c biogenesis protein CcmG/thiol:disulfide interchange protein DsbE
MSWLRFLLPLGLFAALVLFLAVGLGLNPREVPSPLIGKPAPAFVLPKLDDASRSLGRDDLLGQPWVLNVWASWCAPCREEHPLVVDLARRSQVAVVGLNYKDTRAAATNWLRQLGDPYRVSLFDADGRVGIDFGVYGVPETFVVDRQGVIRFKHTGPLTAQVVREQIEPLLKELSDPA